MKEIKNVQPPMRSYHVSPFVVATDDCCCCCWSGFFFSKLRNWLRREISSCFLPHCYKAQGSCRQMLPVATATATRGHIVHRAARETAKNEPLNSRRQLQSARQLCQATTESLLPPPFVSSLVHMWPHAWASLALGGVCSSRILAFNLQSTRLHPWALQPSK